jgi:uncharacterized membrane protein YdbT with pleckstrin-like domain
MQPQHCINASKNPTTLIPGNSMSFTQNQLLPGEQLILLARQHVLVLFRPFLLNLVALILLIGIAFYTGRYWLLAFFLAPLIYFIWEYLAWRNREYILTSRRVVRQEGMFSVSSLDAPLDKINNVYHSQTFMGRLLKYGDVGLETASAQGTTDFAFLANPVNFKNSIVRQREMYRLDSAAAGSAGQTGIPQLLEELASLRDRDIITESEFQEKKKKLLQKI